MSPVSSQVDSKPARPLFLIACTSLSTATQDAMDLGVRHRLPAALCWSMAGITIFFVSFGAAGYLAYGRDVANFITMVREERSLEWDGDGLVVANHSSAGNSTILADG